MSTIKDEDNCLRMSLWDLITTTYFTWDISVK
jgi:hypothetical protein